MTQAGLEVCPEHDRPLHDGQCSKCDYSIPLNKRELGLERVRELRATLAEKHPKQAPNRTRENQ